MSDFKIKVEERTGKPHLTRQAGKTPAVVYGNKFESISIAMDKREFEKLFKKAGTSNLIDMTVGDKKFKTLVHDYQLDPVSGVIIHVDFMKINMKQKIHAEIPLKFVGESTAVINLEGSLINPIDSVEIECLPADLPSDFEIDLSVLDDFEKNIKISDIVLPEGVELLSDPEEVIAFVQEPRSDAELEALDEEIVEDVDSIEVDNAGVDAPAEEGAEEKSEEKKED
jgi:large subunit ribosomal protein L25